MVIKTWMKDGLWYCKAQSSYRATPVQVGGFRKKNHAVAEARRMLEGPVITRNPARIRCFG